MTAKAQGFERLKIPKASNQYAPTPGFFHSLLWKIPWLGLLLGPAQGWDRRGSDYYYEQNPGKPFIIIIGSLIP